MAAKTRAKSAAAIQYTVPGMPTSDAGFVIELLQRRLNALNDLARGGSPVGTPGALVAQRSWDDYSIGRADAIEHLAALDLVYDGVISDYRRAIEQTEEPDPVTQDMLIGHSATLEQFHWFVRAHLENNEGKLQTVGAHTEKSAARRGRR